MVKLMSNPRIATYFQDPMFRNKFELMKKSPEMMMQFIQSDPRFMDVFKELTGIDLMDMQSQQMKQNEKTEEQKKQEEVERQTRLEGMRKKREEEEEAALPSEERQKKENKKKAEDLKNKGNDAYKKKDFETALDFYSQAIEQEPTDLTYYTNKAAVYYEQKQF